MTFENSVIRVFSARRSNRRNFSLLVLLFLAGAATDAWSATLRGTVEGPRGPLANVQVTVFQGFLKAAVRQAHRQGQPAVVYMHPYELDVSEVCDLARAGWRFGRKTALTQSLFRCFVKRRLADLFRTFKFAPMRDVLGV